MKYAPQNMEMVMTASIQLSLMNNLEMKTQIKAYYDFLLKSFLLLKNLNIDLGSKSNVVVQSEKKHEHEEETETAEKVPEVVVVVEVVVEAILVDCF